MLDKVFNFKYNNAIRDIDPIVNNKFKNFIPTEQDGSHIIDTSHMGADFGFNSYSMSFTGTSSNVDAEKQAITQYRRVSSRADAAKAIDDVCDEAIVYNPDEKIVEVQVKNQSDIMKNSIIAEFDDLINIIDFKNKGWKKFRNWYVDGKQYHHIVVDENNPEQGIKEIRYIDPRKIKKIRKIVKHPQTQEILSENEYFIFSEDYSHYSKGFIIEKEAISYVHSGEFDADGTRIVSYLEKAVKYSNMLSMLEDAVVIYRITRAPERRVFYVDVGDLPKSRAEEYMKKIMNSYRNKVTYDSATGTIKTKDNQMNMQEDFWLPRKDGGRGTEVDTLQGGTGLDLDDLYFLQKKLYEALNVPASRMENDTPFNTGRSTEISRDEVKFHKFITRLRNQYNPFFYDLLKVQLILKGVINPSDWHTIKKDISFKYYSDSHFEELLTAEIWLERAELMDIFGIKNPIGKYMSHKKAQNVFFKMSDDEIKAERKQIELEKSDKILYPEEEEIGYETKLAAQLNSGFSTQELEK